MKNVQIERLIKEKQDLDTKIAKLQVFMESDGINTDRMSPYERTDLSTQLQLMVEYQAILQSRLNRQDYIIN